MTAEQLLPIITDWFRKVGIHVDEDGLAIIPDGCFDLEDLTRTIAAAQATLRGDTRIRAVRAVKCLRMALVMTQPQFAALIGRSLSSAIRYETNYAPKKKVLRKLIDIAQQINRPHLARVFQEALDADLRLPHRASSVPVTPDQKCPAIRLRHP